LWPGDGRQGVQVNGSEFAVVAYDDRHRAALLEFREAQYGAGSARSNPAYVDWLYSDTRQSRADRPALFIGLDGARVVGTQGMLHVDLKIGQQELPAAWIVDFAVVKELQRRSGIGSSIALASREGMKVRLALDITDAAVAVALKLGWRHVCDLPLWIRPLDVRQLARTRLPGFAAPAAGFGQVAMDVLLKRGLRFARRHRLELLATGAFDDRADAIWSAASSAYPVASRRDSAYLRWRFDRFPGANAYARYWLKGADGVVGYIVLRFGEHKGTPSAFVIDFFCLPAALPGLMALAIEVCRDAGAIIMYCVTLHPWANASFWPLGFVRRQSGWRFMMYIQDLTPEAARLMSDPSRWFISAGDSNLDHWRALTPSTPAPEPT
jgi:hypothetical protein